MPLSESEKRDNYENELDKFAVECLKGEAVPLEDTPEIIEAFRKDFELINDSDPLPPIALKEKCRPCTDAVFTSIMQDPALLKPFLESVTGKEVDLDESTIHAQFQYSNASVDEQNTVRVDTHALDKKGSIYAVDIQRTYQKHGLRVMYRTFYYSSKQFSSQKVVDMRYEDLKSSYVTFIMSEHTGDNLSGVVHYFISREFDDHSIEHLKGIMDVYEIYAPVSKLPDNKFNPVLQTFAEFFSIKNESEAADFSNKYSGDPIGRRLIRDYAVVSGDEKIIDKLNKEGFYMFKRGDNVLARTEERGREEGKAEGITELGDEILKNMRLKGLSEEFIKQIFGDSSYEIRP